MRCFDLRQSEQQAASSSPKSVDTMLGRSNEECGDDDVAVRAVNFAGGLGLRPIGGLCAAGAGSWRRTLAKGSELERALALLITQTQRRTECRSICRM
jgi:hypothetical protein